MMDVGELMQNLCRTFEPIATTRRNRLKCIETKLPLVISASLEGILPVFTSFLIRSSYKIMVIHESKSWITMSTESILNGVLCSYQ